MDKKFICDCNERVGISIDSVKRFEALKAFFEAQKNADVFEELKPNIPFYSWKNGDRKVEWYATKWYKCNCCNCLWEFVYPDFPGKGFVRKFPDGIYKPKEIVVDGEIIACAKDTELYKIIAERGSFKQ